MLEAKGFSIRKIFAPAASPTELRKGNEADLLLVMGGPMHASESEKYQFLRTEVDILEERAKRELPTMTICLGAQLLMVGIGGKVMPCPEGLILGWELVTADGNAMPEDHPAAVMTNKHFIKSHFQTFTLPADSKSKIIAWTGNLPQIVEYGPNIIGFQAHPEIDGKWLEKYWIRPNSLIGDIKNNFFMLTGRQWDRKKFNHDTQKYIGPANDSTKIFFQEWLSRINLTP